MIVFEKVKWRNFLATGNSFIEMELNNSPLTLITGTNGSGKSTLLDALSFGLFGKPHRNINKPQLVNSINNKNCEVEVEFTVGKNHYRIRRGIRPNVFEIHKNGKMLNQDSKSRDYQKTLEQNILKLNHKSFHQIVVLGSSSFTPFMQLPSQHRREVIEDLLDIGIFSQMNNLLKEESSKIREQIRDADYAISSLEDKIAMQRRHIENLEKIETDSKKKVEEKIQTLRGEIETITKENEKIGEVTKINEIEKSISILEDENGQVLKKSHSLESEMKRVVSEVKFFEKHDHCPTCSQSIGNDLKEEKIGSYKNKAKGISKEYETLQTEKKRLIVEINESRHELEKYRQRSNDIRNNLQRIQRIQKEISELEKSNLNESNQSHLNESKLELENLIENKTKTYELKNELYNESVYNSAVSEMLKDTGIKTKIVKQYLPVINQLINEYLQTLDFFVSFHLDENFNELLKSRHRDEFTYASFSEGEKARIDLALLFCWRQIARMRNSVSTNLLILDETFDSSLDTDGIENLMKIIRSNRDGEHTFIISHKIESLENLSGEHYRYEKVKNFTKMSRVS